MKLERNISVVGLMLLVFVLITNMSFATIDDSFVNSELDGKELIKMGEALNKPLLTLLGKTLGHMKHSIEKDNTEKIGSLEKKLKADITNFIDETTEERKAFRSELCKLKKCTEWSEWSECSAVVNGTFGASTRSRTCGKSSHLCPSSDTEIVEMDSKICQGSKCKSTYMVIQNKFCIRVSNTVKKTWQSARDECQQDGGHLLNIESEMKARDVNETLGKMSVTYDIWIDGTRTLPNGQWIYEYGTEDPGFSNWDSGEPGAKDDCRAYVLHNNVWKWRGRLCSSNYYFLCEII